METKNQEKDVTDISVEQKAEGDTSVVTLSGIATFLREFIERIGHLFAQVAEPAFIEIMSSFADAILAIKESIGDLLSNLIISEISEERKNQLKEAYSKWGEYGWTINPTASTESLFDIIPLSKQEADKAAYKECTHNQLKQLFQMTK